MKAQEIIEKIRAEIERLMQGEQQEIKDMEGALVPNLRSYIKGKRDAFIDTLIVLDKLKELSITRDFNFDDEVVKWIQEHSDVDGTYSGIDFAHHFYELGRQKEQSEKPMQNGLEEEIDKFLNETGAPYYWCNDDEQKDWCTIIARHFYELGRQSKPKVSDEFDEEISNYIEKQFGEPWDGCVPVGCFELSKMAHHFAQWGAEHVKK